MRHVIEDCEDVSQELLDILLSQLAEKRKVTMRRFVSYGQVIRHLYRGITPMHTLRLPRFLGVVISSCNPIFLLFLGMQSLVGSRMNPNLLTIPHSFN
jgi:hypothetical protein